ncbi:MAG: SpoIIE family protein phosphatase [Anaerolineales bacterium]|nr:SpoIIE family protein phosphatase [Anaerolineales bacterium]
MSTNLLAQIPFFTDLPSDELDRLLSELNVVNLQPGEILFREGEPGEHLYIVVKGELEILMAPNTSNELVLNVLHEGEYVGEMSLIQPEGHRSTSARALGEVVLLSMSRNQFKGLLQRHPELAKPMISVLSQRLVNTNVQTFRGLTEKNRQLQKAYDELKAAQEQLIEKERMERELQVAAEIQMSILPAVLPSAEGYDFGGRILPARQVGGDFYDVIDLGGNKFGVLIGDVADKGVPSAIFMARAHALIIAEADSAATPGEVLRAVNKHITRFEKSTQFVTALFGILDATAGEFRYARAGHEPPLLLDKGEVRRLPYKPGMALGLWENIVLDENSLTLPKDSCLIMYTDGLTDCRDPQGEPFGFERVKKTLADWKGNSAQKGCDRLFEALQIHQGGSRQDDDVTLVAVHAKK